MGPRYVSEHSTFGVPAVSSLIEQIFPPSDGVVFAHELAREFRAPARHSDLYSKVLGAGEALGKSVVARRLMLGVG